MCAPPGFILWRPGDGSVRKTPAVSAPRSWRFPAPNVYNLAMDAHPPPVNVLTAFIFTVFNVGYRSPTILKTKCSPERVVPCAAVLSCLFKVLSSLKKTSDETVCIGLISTTVATASFQEPTSYVSKSMHECICSFKSKALDLSDLQA